MGSRRLTSLIMHIVRFMGMLCISESADLDIRRLQGKVDFVLDTVIEVKQGLQDLREEVSSMQQIPGNNLSSARPLVSDNFTKLTFTMGSLIENFESKIAVVLKGFQEEKFSGRQMLKEQKELLNEQSQSVKHMTNTINIIRQESNETSVRYHDEMSNKIEDVNRTVYERLNEISNGYDDAAAQVFTLKGVAGKQEDLTENIKVLSRQVQFFFQLHNIKTYGTSVYSFHKEKIPWAEAQQKCAEENGNLVEIGDSDENEVVKELVGDYYSAWLGASDSEKEGDWRWIRSGLVVQDDLWNTGEPNNAGGDEHCLHIYGRSVAKGHNDRYCGDKLPYVCEREF